MLLPTGVRAENFLLENGYIELNTRSVYYRFFVGDDKQLVLLTSQQKDFLINNLSNANNPAQQKEMQELLERNDDLQSRSILRCIENRFLTK